MNWERPLNLVKVRLSSLSQTFKSFGLWSDHCPYGYPSDELAFSLLDARHGKATCTYYMEILEPQASFPGQVIVSLHLTTYGIRTAI